MPVVVVSSSRSADAMEACLGEGASDVVVASGSLKLLTHRLRYHARMMWLAEGSGAVELHHGKGVYYDILTDLPNRALLLDRLTRRLRAEEDRRRVVGILLVGIDRFKTVNKGLGHGAGDSVLLNWAQRLRSLVLTDTRHEIELARHGGDEFAIAVSGVETRGALLEFARAIQAALRAPFVIEGCELVLTGSVGIAVYPEDGEDALALLRHADTAMYHAKDEGRDTVRFYDVAMSSRAKRVLEIENGLEWAVDRQQLFIEYQPLVDVLTGQMHSVEALVRWEHPKYGLVAPAEFVPAAEERGLIGRIGAWVLDRVCQDIRAWKDEGLELTVAANLSPFQWADGAVIGHMQASLEKHGVDAGQIVLELTESAVVTDGDGRIEVLKGLRELGLHLALDDFGTGYASMAYLKRLPLDRIKIDRSFVEGVTQDSESVAIVRAIVTMAQSLGLEVVAEGVETQGQAHVLTDMGCGMLQGFYVSRPVKRCGIASFVGRQWEVVRDSGSRGEKVVEGRQ